MSSETHMFLVKILSPGGSRAHLIDKMSFSIGRAQEADLPFLSPSVSRIHMKIEHQNGQVMVIDQGSANGSYMNNQRLEPQQPYPVTGSTRIKLGTSEEDMIFELIPKPLELMNPDMQKKVLMSSMSELFRVTETQMKKDLEKEIQKIRESGQKELDQIKMRAQNEAQKYIDQTKIDAERMIMDASRESEKIQSLAMKSVMENQNQAENSRIESERIIMEARREAEKIQSHALSEALSKKKELESARMDAERIVMEGRREAEKIQSQALSGVLDKKKQLEQEMIEIEQTAQSQLNQARFAAQREADAIIGEAQKQIKRDYEEGSKKIEGSLKEAKEKSKEIVRSAESKADEIILQAKNESQIHRQNWETEAQEIRASAEEDAQQIKEEAKAKAASKLAAVQEQVQLEVKKLTEEHRLDLVRKKDQAQREYEETRVKLAALAKKEAHAEQEKLIKEYSVTIDELKHKQISLDSQVQSLTIEEKRLTEQMAFLTKTNEEMDLRQRDEQSQIVSLRDQVQQSKEIIAKAEAASARLSEIEEKRKKAGSDFESYERRYKEGIAKIEQEIKEKREKAILEYDSSRRSQNEDLAKSKLKSLEDVKKQIEREERRYFETMQLRAVEVAKSLEIKIIPKVEELIKSGRGTESIGDLLPLIKAAVDEGILKQKTNVEAGTQHLGVDVQEEVENRRKMKRYIGAALAAGFVGILVFHKELREYANKIHLTSVQESLDRRNAESIYSPAQDDDWKESFTDNVLYTRLYYDTKTDSLYSDQWTLRLNDVDFVRSLKLNEEDVIRYVAREMNLIQKLGALRDSIDATKLDEGINNMRKAEKEDIDTMLEIVKTEANLTRIRDLEKDFTQRYIKRKKPASTAK